MSSLDSGGRFPQDLVAIFHASFHPTQGNIIDWSLKANEDLSLDNLEFSALPSGLHLVEQDVVCVSRFTPASGPHLRRWVCPTTYFNKDGQHGVCVFRRRKTTEQGHRGFRLSSLGILLAKSARPRPWRHTAALKELTTLIYARFESSASLVPADSDWEPARAFFNERKAVRASLGGAGDWNGWSHELLDDDAVEQNPAVHLPHFLRILGPSSLTLYKHVVGRRRILIYTHPPVEAASVLCQVAADMCYELQVEYSTPSSSSSPLRGRCKEAINVLGMVTLNDLDRLQKEGDTGRGWVACTTDAIFLEKPACYDLLVDLTTLSPNRATRPTLYASRAVPPAPGSSRSRGPTHRLSVVRFSWSDVRLWNELNRLIHLDASASSHDGRACCSLAALAQDPKASTITAWTDAWRVYEDVCVLCAGLWMGAWRGGAAVGYATAGGVRLEGDEELSLRAYAGGHVRPLGMGIEGGPAIGAGGSGGKAVRRSSGMSWASSKAAAPAADDDDGDADDTDTDTDAGRREAQILTTLSLLQTLHTHTAFQLAQLEQLLPPTPGAGAGPGDVVCLSPRDVAALELGPISAADARYLAWLAREYAGGAHVVVRRGWREVLGVVFGFG
ncbi:hypothetical protein GGX14DRAFT_661774 [Mycena pura]|uniref:Protein LCHN n=1 Tax=Mycena pura TaxID=153505 RepID=A0AAD6Y8R2_9AGAR|nr:hypothetical protein GGX14DRAFT_661774 [Mycena pura]